MTSGLNARRLDDVLAQLDDLADDEPVHRSRVKKRRNAKAGKKGGRSRVHVFGTYVKRAKTIAKSVFEFFHGGSESDSADTDDSVDIDGFARRDAGAMEGTRRKRKNRARCCVWMVGLGTVGAVIVYRSMLLLYPAPYRGAWRPQYQARPREPGWGNVGSTCPWERVENRYLGEHAAREDGTIVVTIDNLQAQLDRCDKLRTCGGVTCDTDAGPPEQAERYVAALGSAVPLPRCSLRAGMPYLAFSSVGEVSYVRRCSAYDHGSSFALPAAPKEPVDSTRLAAEAAAAAIAVQSGSDGSVGGLVGIWAKLDTGASPQEEDWQVQARHAAWLLKMLRGFPASRVGCFTAGALQEGHLAAGILYSSPTARAFGF
jgi:hypothetical protein